MAQSRWWLFGLVALLPLWIVAGLVEQPLMHNATAMRLGGALIGLLWGWLFAAVVLGGAVGAYTWNARSPSWTDRPVHLALGLFGIVLLLAIAGWPAHRAGHWLDLGCLLIVAYALGCVSGWGLREVAEASPGPEVARVLVQARTSGGAGSLANVPLEPSPFGRPAYLSKPGREPFFVPGTGIVEPRAAAALAAARDAAAGIVRAPAPSTPAAPTIAERPPYLSKPGPIPFYLPGAGITDPRTAIAMQPVWRHEAPRAEPMSSDAVSSDAVSSAPAPAIAPSLVLESAAAAPPAAPALDQPDPLSLVPATPEPSFPPAATTAPLAPPAVAAASVPAPVMPPPAETLSMSPDPAMSAGPSTAAAAGPGAPEVSGIQTAAMAAASEARPASPAQTSTVPEPAPSPPVVDQDRHAGERPPGLVSARGDAPDRLQRIKGIGPQNEVRLNTLGIWHFVQIAEWTPAHKTWVGSYLAFPGRIEREQWIEQAQVLAAGGAGFKDAPRPRRPRS